MLTPIQFIRYQMTADDCVRLEMPPDVMFRSEYSAKKWLDENKATAKWRGYVTVMFPEL